MKVFRERPDQRQNHRVTAPLFLIYQNETYRVENWSLGGIKVMAPECQMPVIGDEILIDISIPFQGFNICFPATLKVVRTNPVERMFAGKFMSLGERERDLMELFIEDLIRGNMSDARDTIQRIDVPVTPISTKPDVDPGVQVPIRRWSRKTVFMTAFYVIAGLFIFGYLALLVYTNFVRLEIRSAIVSRPVIVAKALADGRVQSYHFNAGDVVEQGDLIAELSVPDVQNGINEAKIDVMRYEGSLSRAKKALGNAKRFKLTENQIEKLRLEVSKQEAELEASTMHQEMMEASIADHYIRAPFDARIVELRKPAGSTIIYKEPILILERLGAPTIEAYLTQEQVMKIALNDYASFYIPSLKIKAQARIVSVNRTSNNLDEDASRYFWQDQNAKTALVKLEVLFPDSTVNWPAGLPATVLFKRHKDNTPLLLGGKS